jgi:hypothetical protein
MIVPLEKPSDGKHAISDVSHESAFIPLTLPTNFQISGRQPSADLVATRLPNEINAFRA